MTMDDDRCALPLDDHLDGRITGSELTRLMEHLDGCDACRAELEAMSSLRAAARALPREIAPPRDLWSGIAARIADPGRERDVVDLSSRRAALMRTRRWLPLAAAALLLVVVSSGLTVVLLRRGPVVELAGVRVDGRDEPGGSAPAASLASFRPAEIAYEQAIESLEAQLQARRGSLAPETVRVIETNLDIIDHAIAEARAALESDPSSSELPLHLSDVYGRKVELLRSAVRMAT